MIALSLRSVASISRSSAFISASVSRRFARTAAWHAIVASSSFTAASMRFAPLPTREIAEQVAH